MRSIIHSGKGNILELTMLMANECRRVCVFRKTSLQGHERECRGTGGGERRRTLRGFSPPGNFNAENLGGETE